MTRCSGVGCSDCDAARDHRAATGCLDPQCNREHGRLRNLHRNPGPDQFTNCKLALLDIRTYGSALLAKSERDVSCIECLCNCCSTVTDGPAVLEGDRVKSELERPLDAEVLLGRKPGGQNP